MAFNKNILIEIYTFISKNLTTVLNYIVYFFAFVIYWILPKNM